MAMYFADLVIGGTVTQAPIIKRYAGKKEHAIFGVAVNNVRMNQIYPNYYICKAWFPLSDLVLRQNIQVGDIIVCKGNFEMQYANGKCYPTLTLDNCYVVQSKLGVVGEHAEDPLKTNMVLANKDTYTDVEFEKFKPYNFENNDVFGETENQDNKGDKK